MIDPTHLAIVVYIHEGTMTDVEVVVGPNLGIGAYRPAEAQRSPGVRCLLVEVKTTSIDTSEAAIYDAATRIHRTSLPMPLFALHHTGLHEWVLCYESKRVREKSLSLDECFVYGREEGRRDNR